MHVLTFAACDSSALHDVTYTPSIAFVIVSIDAEIVSQLFTKHNLDVGKPKHLHNRTVYTMHVSRSTTYAT